MELPDPEQEVFKLVGDWLSHPVKNRSLLFNPYGPDDKEHYFQTQLVAAIVRFEGFDGIEFPSSVHCNGRNVALFNPSTACVVDTVEVISGRTDC